MVVNSVHICRYLFSCNKWLSKSEDDGRTERVLHLSFNNDEETNGLLQQNIQKKLYDDHLWFSVAYRMKPSKFTRVQRLSACLAILFLTMVSNAMWYKTGSETSGQAALTLGPISITVQQLYTSIMSSLVVVPPILIITFIFSRTGERKQQHSMQRIQGNQTATRRRCQLPFWCLFLAYFLVFLSVACGAFFTILYALQWGKEQSTAWLISFLLGFVESVLLIQPLKVCVLQKLV